MTGTLCLRMHSDGVELYNTFMKNCRWDCHTNVVLYAYFAALQSNCRAICGFINSLGHYAKNSPFLYQTKSELVLSRHILYPFQGHFLKSSRLPEFLYKWFDLIHFISRRSDSEARMYTRSASVSVSCHSVKSKTSFSRAGNASAFRPPQGQKSSLSVKRVVDQSRHMWSRFGGLRCPFVPNPV